MKDRWMKRRMDETEEGEAGLGLKRLSKVEWVGECSVLHGAAAGHG